MRETGISGVFRALGLRDRFVIGAFALLALGALLYWVSALYLSSTENVPDHGGRYVEGMVGQPRYVNPILSSANSADDVLSRVVYSGLFGYDSKGRIRNDLAEHVSISEDRREYVVTIRGNAKFHDGHDVTSHDVVFTVNAIKDPAYRSPLRQNWQGVDAEARDDRTVVFTLKKPYFGFLEHLTVGILPKHVWETVAPENFSLADPNLAPIGSGPYRFFDFGKDSNGNILSFEFRAFPDFYDGEPYITKLIFNFYPDEDGMIDAFRKKEIMGMSPLSPEKGMPFLGEKGVSVKEFHLPRVFGVFFNTTKSVPLAYAEVREALARATDRDALVREALSEKGLSSSLPFLPFMEGNPELQQTGFDLDAANRILNEKEWKMQDDGIRKKGDVRLAFDLMVPDWLELRRTADVLREQWKKVGVAVEVKIMPLSELNQDVVRPRNYEAVLYGEEMSIHPDFFSFWHSSGKDDPGLNLSLFKDDAADELLLKLREESDPDKRNELLRDFMQILSEKHPAVFLYSPNVFYVTDDSVRGWDTESANSSAGRVSGIAKWYVETKRVLKK